MNEEIEDVMQFVENILIALLCDLKEQGADKERLERITNMIEDGNIDIVNPIIQARANVSTILALAKALTHGEAV